MAARLHQLSRPYLDKKMSNYLELYENDEIIITRSGCHIHKKSAKSTNDYKTVELSNKIYVKEHQLIFFLYYHECSNQTQEISHLCNNKKCINIRHLSLEPHCVNMQRKSCHSTGPRALRACKGHFPYNDCSLINRSRST